MSRGRPKDPVDLEEYRRRRGEAPAREPGATHVPCARCGEQIPITTTRCPHCGVHFLGQAEDFEYGVSPQPTAERYAWLMFLLGAALAIALLLTIYLLA